MGFFSNCRPVLVDGVKYATIGEASRKFGFPPKMLTIELEDGNGLFEWNGHKFSYAEVGEAKTDKTDFVPSEWGYEINGIVYKDTIGEAAEFAFVSVKRLKTALSSMRSCIIDGFKFALVPKRTKHHTVHDKAWRRRQSKILNSGVKKWVEYRGVSVDGTNLMVHKNGSHNTMLNILKGKDGER